MVVGGRSTNSDHAVGALARNAKFYLKRIGVPFNQYQCQNLQNRYKNGSNLMPLGIDLWEQFGRFGEPKWSQVGTKTEPKNNVNIYTRF